MSGPPNVVDTILESYRRNGCNLPITPTPDRYTQFGCIMDEMRRIKLSRETREDLRLVQRERKCKVWLENHNKIEVVRCLVKNLAVAFKQETK